MTRPRKIAVGVAVLVAAGSLLAWWNRSDEPEYQGVTRSRWMAKYCLRYLVPEADYRAEYSRIYGGLHAMGTNATTYLVDLSDCTEDSSLFTQIRSQLRQEIPSHLAADSERIELAKRIWQIKLGQIHQEADSALWDLKPDADELLPLLAPRFASRDAAIRGNAYWLLRVIGANPNKAEPFLIRGLQDANETNRMTATYALVVLKVKSTALALALSDAIEKASPEQQLELMYRIKSLAPLDKEAMPAMLRVLEGEHDPVRRLKIAAAICWAAPDQPEALKVMMEALGDPVTRIGAIQSLARLRPVPKIPGELLVEALHDERVFVVNSVLADLVSLGPPKDAAMPLLMQALATGNEYARIEAALQLLRLEPNHGVAISTLISMAQLARHDFDELAVEALGKAGSNASAAVPKLEKLIAGAPVSRRDAIHSALEKIRGVPVTGRETNVPVRRAGRGE